MYSLLCGTHDIQPSRVTRVRKEKLIGAGYRKRNATEGVDVQNKFLTTFAMARLGT